MTGISGRLRRELSARWPFTSEREEAPALNSQLGLFGDFALDTSLPPVWFVGDLDGCRYLLVGVNPGRGEDGTPSWDAEREAITQSFERYWRSRLGYFSGPAYNRQHYDPTGTLVAVLAGQAASPRDALASLCVQIEMVPFFSKHQNLSEHQVASVRTGTETGRLAQRLLASCLEASPEAVVFRGAGGALRALLAEHDGRIDTQVPYVGSVGRLKVSSPRPVQLITLSGNYAVPHDSIRLLGAMSRGENVEWPKRGGRQRGTHRPPTAKPLYEQARATVLALDPNIAIRPRTGGLRSEAFRHRRNFARLIEHRSSVEVHLLESPNRFSTDFRVFNEEDLAVLVSRIATAYEFGS